MNLKSTLIIVLFILSFSTNIAALETPQIRVKVMENAHSVTLDGLGQRVRLISRDNRSEEWVGTKANIVATESGLMLNGANRGKELTFTTPSQKFRVSNKTYRGTITVEWKDKGQAVVIDKLSVEDYLTGLINSEISSSWPTNAIKAQAIAARTYALNQVEAARKSSHPRSFDITSTMLDQVYEGAHLEDFRAKKAVSATRGEVLLRSSSVFAAYYHSCCGGHTEYAHNVWPGEKDFSLVDDPHCADSPKFNWRFEVPFTEFLGTLAENGYSFKNAHALSTSPLLDSPRIGEVIIEDDNGFKMLKATELRKIFGYANIKSTWFDVAVKGKNIIFSGRGYGHGVGLCQWGAKGMAEKGFDYRDILKFYYPDAEVVTYY